MKAIISLQCRNKNCMTEITNQGLGEYSKLLYLFILKNTRFGLQLHSLFLSFISCSQTLEYHYTTRFLKEEQLGT